MIQQRIVTSIAAITLAVSAYCQSAAAQEILYVNGGAPSGGDGVSWQTPYNDLQDALDNARMNPIVTQIWVTEGAYKPDRNTSDQDLSFDMVSNVAVLGGFVGNEKDEVERNPLINETILSGDINGDDESGFVNVDDNTHVIVQFLNLTAAATLDGFMIQGANNQRVFAIGGGALVNGGEAVIKQCSFKDNRSISAGAGIFVSEDSTLNLEDSSIVGSLAFIGAGMYINEADVTVTDTQFVENQTGFADPNPGCGGGVQIFRGRNVRFERCLFQDNQSFCGGGVSSVLSDSIKIIDSEFIGNIGHRLGGGLRLDRSDENDLTPAVIDGCRFIENVNEVPIFGGGAIFSTETIMKLTNSIFIANDTTFFDPVFEVWVGLGSVHIRHEVGHQIANCLFASNTAGSSAGLAVSGNNTAVEVKSCTFANNTAQAGNGGVGIVTGQPVLLDIDNCILWGNRGNDGASGGELFQIIAGPAATVDHSLIEGLTGALGGEGNISDEPIFVDSDGADDHPGTLDDDYRLTIGSPGMDEGNAVALPEDYNDIDDDEDFNEQLPLDLDSNDRVTGIELDMGAYELVNLDCPWDLDSDGSVGTGDLLLLFSQWAANPAGPPDFNNDGTVGIADLLILFANWGECP